MEGDEKCHSSLVTQYTITEKMADKGRSDFHVVFTNISCGTNFSIWPQAASQSLYT